MLKSLLFLATSLLFTATPAWAAEYNASAHMNNPEQKAVGMVEFTEGPNGLVAAIDLKSLTPGWHAIHIHEKGDCSEAGFTSAGSHAAPGHDKHGFLIEGGKHEGDMPNIYVHSDGISRAHYFLNEVHLAELLDEDGAAVIVHAGEDDYTSQPSGNAGDRIACGVINKH